MLTIFSHMTALAQEYGAINLAQGFPDFLADERLGELVYAAIRDGHNQYAPMAGLMSLREGIAMDWYQRYNVVVDPLTEITITPGATYGLFAAFQSVLKPGDEVIVLEPAYDSYVPAIRQAGAVPVPVALSAPDFRPDFEAIRDAISSRTKAIVVNTPHNPAGSLWSVEDWDQLASILHGTEIVVISDEVYEQLVFDGDRHRSVLQHEELRQRAFAVFSFGKSLHATGWKMGYAIGAPELMERFRAVHQYLAFSVNTPTQVALASYLRLPVKDGPAALLEGKRNLFLELLKETPFKALAPARGSYFQLVSYEGISELPEKAFAEWLTKEHGVAAIPVSAFYTEGREAGLLRFCFAKREETLRSATEKLGAVRQMVAVG
jgi:methionine aminotransferase